MSRPVRFTLLRGVGLSLALLLELGLYVLLQELLGAEGGFAFGRHLDGIVAVTAHQTAVARVAQAAVDGEQKVLLHVFVVVN